MLGRQWWVNNFLFHFLIFLFSIMYLFFIIRHISSLKWSFLHIRYSWGPLSPKGFLFPIAGSVFPLHKCYCIQYMYIYNCNKLLKTERELLKSKSSANQGRPCTNMWMHHFWNNHIQMVLETFNRSIWLHRMQRAAGETSSSKTVSGYVANFFVTNGTAGCCYDNCWCHQR